MKKILSLMLSAAMLFAAQPSLLIKGVAKGLHPLPIESLSQESGGALAAEQAYSDGIGVMMVDPIGTETTDYSTLNDLVLKHGSAASAAGMPLRDYVLTIGSAEDKAKAELLAVFYHDGTPCDDGDDLTIGETYLDGVCQGGVIPDGTACDDGNRDTINDVYTSGVCMGEVDYRTASILLDLSSAHPDGISSYFLDVKVEIDGQIVTASLDNGMITSCEGPSYADRPCDNALRGRVVCTTAGCDFNQYGTLLENRKTLIIFDQPYKVISISSVNGYYSYRHLGNVKLYNSENQIIFEDIGNHDSKNYLMSIQY